MKIECKKVKIGDLMAFVYYGTVKTVNNNGHNLQICDVDNKNKFDVDGVSLVENALSADQFTQTEKVNKTQAAEKLVRAYNRPFTVIFTKTNGRVRKLRGRLIKPEPLLGRSVVEDLDITRGSPLRQVDHRTIKELIVDGIRYVVK